MITNPTRFPSITAMLQNEVPGSIFEVGCASGHLFYLPVTEDGFTLGGMDILDVSDAIKMYGGEFITHNANDVPYPIKSKSYDYVVSVGTLLLLENPIPAMKEMLRIAKKKVILAEFHHEEPEILDGRQFRRNYKELFNQLNKECTIEYNKESQKHIIKVNI